MIETILFLVFVGVIAWVVIMWLAREIGTPKTHGLQREVDLRLTYKRYTEIYPSSRITYPEYKKMQAQRAYRKAVSSTKIKRMVR